MKPSPNGIENPSILIVDDDDDILTSFKLWLRVEGFNPLCASNSSQAIKILNREEIKVVLLDYRLEFESGLSAAEKLSLVCDDLRIILFTNFPSYQIAVETIKSGLYGYISKEEPKSKILELINNAFQAKDLNIKESLNRKTVQPLLRYLVICKHSLIREQFQSFSYNHPEFKLVKSSSCIEHLKSRKKVQEVDIVLICANCCIKSFDYALIFFQELYQVFPRVKPVIFNENFAESEKVDLVKIGVKGFLPIESGSELLKHALKMIHKGELWISRRLSSMAISSHPDNIKKYFNTEVKSYHFSTREKEILKAMALGLKNKEIADKLFISDNTVKSHLNNIFKKINVKNRAQAIIFAMENKIF